MMNRHVRLVARKAAGGGLCGGGGNSVGHGSRSYSLASMVPRSGSRGHPTTTTTTTNLSPLSQLARRISAWYCTHCVVDTTTTGTHHNHHNHNHHSHNHHHHNANHHLENSNSSNSSSSTSENSHSACLTSTQVTETPTASLATPPSTSTSTSTAAVPTTPTNTPSPGSPLALQPQRRPSGTIPEADKNETVYGEIPSYHQLLRNNRDWAIRKRNMNQEYFNWLSSGQKPPYLYIGCSDSRMALNDMVGSRPGAMFVHRNIANQVCINDMGFLSVLTYAVEVLKVKHIIVCGHYDCGGVKAAMAEDPDSVHAVVSNWVNPVKRLYMDHKQVLSAITDRKARVDKLVELNVVQQVSNLCQTASLRVAFKGNSYPQLHGWIFNIYNGLIKELQLPIREWIDLGYLPPGYSDTFGYDLPEVPPSIKATMSAQELYRTAPDMFFPE